MQYKRVPMLNCRDDCMYKRYGEICELTLAKYQEHYDNGTFERIKCAGPPSSYTSGKIKEQLLLEERGYDIYGNPIEQTTEARQSEAVAPVQQENTGAEPPQIIPTYASYVQYKAALDGEIRSQAEGFVRIGYLLKIARDTNILFESGYKDLYEFAMAEYRLDKSQVSRYISINDRFSEDGYSMKLLPHYQGFGIAKLAIMLTLPDEVNEQLTPDYSKSEIQTVREEITEEQKVTEIERLLEGQDEESLLSQLVRELGRTHAEIFREIQNSGLTTDALKQILAPSGENLYSVRLRGIGRVLFSVKDYEENAVMINSRTSEKETCTWEELLEAWKSLIDAERTPEENYKNLYGEDISGVPAESKSKETNGMPKRPKVTKAKPEKSVKEADPGTETETSEPQQQLPGQRSIANYPEYLPAEQRAEKGKETAEESHRAAVATEDRKDTAVATEELSGAAVTTEDLQEAATATETSPAAVSAGAPPGAAVTTEETADPSSVQLPIHKDKERRVIALRQLMQAMQTQIESEHWKSALETAEEIRDLIWQIKEWEVEL